ncbi:hypothetical protein ACFOMD_09230 [Sphingoaurantiacus capsulatus]|uniref:Lipoprotein n=1 Tax=Sphingoaurantiacus capsulatus TaxID=1771310 RepID=A0ABV7XA93_9SPHN
MTRIALLATAALLAACNGDPAPSEPKAEPKVATKPGPPSAAVIASQEPGLPARIRVSTNEPFWQAVIDGEVVSLTGVDSQPRRLSIIADAVIPDGRRVTASDAKGTVTVEVYGRECINDMSGAPFPYSGSIGIDGTGPFKGCAAPADAPMPPEPTAIPAVFIGLWAKDEEGCRVPASSIEWVRVTSQALRFHESLGTLRGVRASNADSVELDLAFEGEGETWQAIRTLRRSGDVLTISGKGVAPLRRIRCATGDEAAVVSDGETSPTAAREVVLRYYAAIDRRDYGSAYALWGDGGRASGKSAADFARGFAETEKSRVTAGLPSAPQGAAGSLYVEVPVQVAATLRSGAEQRFAGSYTLRRVNGLPGATPAQLRWHIHRATLRPVR